MKSDINFEVKQPKNGYGDQAYWQWSILPLVEEKYWKSTKAVVNKVQYEWRRRLYKLRKAGYPPLQNRYVFARNCPPAGVWVNQTSRQCHLDRICPFCWGRTYVFQCWSRLIPTLFAKEGKRSHRDRNLIRAARTWRFDNLDTALRAVRADRKVELDKLTKSYDGYFGAAKLVQFYPDEQSLNGVFMRVATIVTVPDQSDYVPVFEQFGYKAKLYEQVTKQDLVQIVGRHAAFSSKLFRCDAKAAAKLLESLKGFRTCSYYGDMTQAASKID
ncbi:MAG: hypothetical protein KDA74_25250 [Planctomycetaceae bacterium]|nr:hypothetical protein [Planctomycetaceae bacterium]